MLKSLYLGIGINAYPDCPLKGCLNDIKETQKNLTEKFGFTNVVILDDNSVLKPTYENILVAMYEAGIASWRQNLDLIWIHYSGHGSQLIDKSGDEVSGMDSCWCPIDYNSSSMVLDDSIARALKNFNPKTRILIFSDSCHSATIADLPYSYDCKTRLATGTGAGQRKTEVWEQNITVISGCLDTGTSADAYFAATRSFGGALTGYFWKLVMKLGPEITVRALIDELHTNLTKDGYDQYPVFTSTRPLKGDDVLISKKEKLWRLV